VYQLIAVLRGIGPGETDLEAVALEEEVSDVAIRPRDIANL
jgi:hypothetical protein